jgi:predicted unusual protein kinase regulating ubiquinone biosynthesis (AarF/ABC1/UbiB family)
MSVDPRQQGYSNGVSPGLQASHAGRYARIGKLLLEHLDVRDYARGTPTANETGSHVASDADKLVAELESLGPTYIKLGQLLSTRSDLLPPAYLQALGRLRDKVAPMAEGEAERVIADELGVRVSRAFKYFGAAPIGSASLGQVHRAALRDGRPVAVKVQREGVRAQVVDDMEVITELAQFLDAHSERARRLGVVAMVGRFRGSLFEELDYLREAGNLRAVGDNLSSYRRIVIPQPVADYCTSRVLTMDYVGGKNVAAIGPLTLTETECGPLADELFRAYLDQVLVYGLFHADPHPGNVLLTDDGRLGLVDFGQVARLAPPVQELLLRLLLAVSDGNGTQASAALRELGQPLEDFDQAGLDADVSDMVLRLQHSAVADVQTGKVLGEIARAALDHGLRPPAELTLVGKAMLNLDEIARRLDAGFKPEDAINAHAASLMRHRMLKAASPARLLAGALDATEFAEQLPSRMNKVLESLASGNFTVNVEGVDEAELMRGVQKLANRAATAVVIAAFVLAAAIFGVSRRGPTAAGYPVVSLVLLGLAALAGLWLLVGVVRSDLPQHRRPRP